MFRIFLLFVVLGIFSAVVFGNSSRSPQKAFAKQTIVYPTISGKAPADLQINTFGVITATPEPLQKVSECGSVLGKKEANIIYSVDPAPGTTIRPGGSLKVWYNDEYPLTLGVSTISPWNASSYVANPIIGTLSKKDANNFPFYPAVFISDVTTNERNTSGLARTGGKAFPPDEVYGTWKPLGFIDRYSSSLPPENNTTLPPKADPFPSTPTIASTSVKGKEHKLEGYSSEILWHASSLGLTPGHTYLAEIIVHDGDKEGDIGDLCMVVKY